MGFIDVSELSYSIGGTTLFRDASFRVGEGSKVALVGANGTGKTTLLRLIAGDIKPDTGTISSSGGIGVMRQFIGSTGGATTVRDFLLGLAAEPIRIAGAALHAAERRLAEEPNDSAVATAYAQAVADWASAGGYEAEVTWNVCCESSIGESFETVRDRLGATLSGGEQKRLALEVLLRGDEEVLLLDEPDNYLDVTAKRQLEKALRATGKTVLYVSHDRQVLAETANRVVTLEGHGVWVHGGGFADYAEAREARLGRLDELHRRWEEEHVHLKDLVRRMRIQATMSDAMASRLQAAVTRLRKFEEAGPPAERPRRQDVRIRLRGGRTGVRVLTCEQLAIPGLVRQFDLEVTFGERIALLGNNGTGKSHLLRLFAGEAVAHEGRFVLGARVTPGHFKQTHEHPELRGTTLVESLHQHGRDKAGAMRALDRYELVSHGDQDFTTLSGGQQARFLILLLEIGGATLLLLDEPTDNLDVHSAEALERGLDEFEGTVISVTHDRWFARRFNRFVVVAEDGAVTDQPAPVWD
ncbi:MAG: ABC-F family ATP-binding cassette domain-containing protein [Candidatus Dormibacteria bacterium]